MALRYKKCIQVFNMGHRMEIYLPENVAGEVVSISKSFGVDAKIIGRVEKRCFEKINDQPQETRS